MVSIIKKFVTFITTKLILINDSINKIISLPETTSKTFNYISKATCAADAAKGTLHFAETIVCNDGICAVVSAFGLAADTLQIRTHFIPDPNVTSVVTAPISVGCKVFVWCCKRSKLLWGKC